MINSETLEESFLNHFLPSNPLGLKHYWWIPTQTTSCKYKKKL